MKTQVITTYSLFEIRNGDLILFNHNLEFQEADKELKLLVKRYPEKDFTLFPE